MPRDKTQYDYAVNIADLMRPEFLNNRLKLPMIALDPVLPKKGYEETVEAEPGFDGTALILPEQPCVNITWEDRMRALITILHREFGKAELRIYRRKKRCKTWERIGLPEPDADEEARDDD